MTDIDKTIDSFARAEKFNKKTGKFETFRTYDVRPKNPVEAFYRKKRK